jgi:hypothetical protein
LIVVVYEYKPTFTGPIGEIVFPTVYCEYVFKFEGVVKAVAYIGCPLYICFVFMKDMGALAFVIMSVDTAVPI